VRLSCALAQRGVPSPTAVPMQLPTSTRDVRGGGRFHSGSSMLPPYLRRALSSHQMDWEYAFTQMVYCCTAPWKLYVCRCALLL